MDCSDVASNGGDIVVDEGVEVRVEYKKVEVEVTDYVVEIQ